MVVVQGIQAEVRTYNTIITACNKSGKPDESLKVGCGGVGRGPWVGVVGGGCGWVGTAGNACLCMPACRSRTSRPSPTQQLPTDSCWKGGKLACNKRRLAKHAAVLAHAFGARGCPPATHHSPQPACTRAWLLPCAPAPPTPGDRPIHPGSPSSLRPPPRCGAPGLFDAPRCTTR